MPLTYIFFDLPFSRKLYKIGVISSKKMSKRSYAGGVGFIGLLGLIMGLSQGYPKALLALLLGVAIVFIRNVDKVGSTELNIIGYIEDNHRYMNLKALGNADTEFKNKFLDCFDKADLAKY